MNGILFADISQQHFSHPFVRPGKCRVIFKGRDVTDDCWAFHSILGFGWVKLYKKDPNGDRLRNGDRVATETLHGRVHITFND